MLSSALIERLDVEAFTIPTDSPESDGTLTWDHTTIVVVHAHAAGQVGLGYTYAHRAAVAIVQETLTPVVVGQPVMAVERAYVAMRQAVRNAGGPGVSACAISAVDAALWDLKARVLGVPLVDLLGPVRDAVPIYGSGGFTSYSESQLAAQLGGWAAQGLRAVKMKIGREPGADRVRVARARQAIGPRTALLVDANGAYGAKLAVEQGRAFAEARVSWFEEPVSSDDLDGLRFVRERVPMDVAAGEYGYTPHYFQAMLAADAVDVLQADATRCGGVSGFLRASAIADAAGWPLSAHTAPSLHAHVGCASARLRHVEYFHDHVRIERMLFDGVLDPVDGSLRPDRARPGCGLTFKARDARRFAA